MADLIKKIRTDVGDLQIDYTALANLPDLSQFASNNDLAQVAQQVTSITPDDIGAISSAQIVNDLTTETEGSVLDARQGKWLNENKVGYEDIADNLTTDDAQKVLSAAQGVVLNGRIAVFENAITVAEDSIDLNGKYIDNALFR